MDNNGGDEAFFIKTGRDLIRDALDTSSHNLIREALRALESQRSLGKKSVAFKIHTTYTFTTDPDTVLKEAYDSGHLSPVLEARWRELRSKS